MNKWIIQIASDFAIWLSIFVVLTRHEYLAQYGENLIIFYCWVVFIFGILGIFSSNAMEKECRKNSDKLKKSKALDWWQNFSTWLEVFAIAIIGFPFTAFAYLVGWLLMKVTMEHAMEKASKPLKEEVAP